MKVLLDPCSHHDRRADSPSLTRSRRSQPSWLADSLVIMVTIDMVIMVTMSVQHEENPVKPIDMKRAALVLIEFQHEWLAPDGKLQQGLIRDKEAFRAAVSAAGELVSHARERRWTIAHAGLSFARDPNYLLFARGEDKLGLRGAIPRAGTWGEEGSRFVEPFVPREGEFVVQGRSGASVLKSSTLDPFLRNHDVKTLLLCGFATHVCVESTLREAHDLGYDAYVVSDACAAFERSQHEHVIQHVVHHFGGHVTSAELRAY